MFIWFKKIQWLKVFNYIAYSLAFFLIEYIITFQLLFKFNMQHCWMVIPIVLFVVFIGKIIGKKDLSTKFLSTVSLISLILMFLNKNFVNACLSQNIEMAEAFGLRARQEELLVVQ